MKPKSKFKALYNPFTRNLLVKYGKVLSEHTFEELEEWTKVSYNGDEEHPCYLHIQLDYDEYMQLIFYPRVDGSEELNEALCSTYNSNCSNNSSNIKLVYSDREWDYKLKTFLRLNDAQVSSFRKINY